MKTSTVWNGWIVSLKKDPNAITPPDWKPGDEWIHPHTLRLSRSDLKIQKERTEDFPFQHAEHGKSCYHVRHYSNGMVGFGLEVEKDKPRHGGEWSTNPASIREATGMSFQEVTYEDANGWSMAGHIREEDFLAIAKELETEGWTTIPMFPTIDPKLMGFWRKEIA